jgi:SPP1 family predicted phage head-tail adaptor
MAIVEIGKMDKRITFRNPTVTDDTSAGSIATYSDWFTTWAYVEKIRGDRSFDYGFDGLKNNYKFYCFYRSSMSALSKATRITYNGKDYGLLTWELIDEVKHLYRFNAEEVS